MINDDIKSAIWDNRTEDLKAIISQYPKIIFDRGAIEHHFYNDNDGNWYERETAAYFAAKSGRYECLKVIVEEAPETLAFENKDGKTPAYVAAYGDRAECLKIIAERAPETLAIADNDGDTPAVRAAWSGKIECLKIIAEHAPATLATANHKGATPAIIAAKKGLIDCLKFIAEKAPETLTIENEDGNTPEMILKWEHPEIYKKYLLVMKNHETPSMANKAIDTDGMKLKKENNDIHIQNLQVKHKLSKKWWQFWK